ncbi:VOC family protein [Natrarchaeobius oligotrophus]|nr:VOC family protein [Natrarchaeobius chitinivorans]
MTEHAVVRVTDLDAAVEFYTEQLGLIEIDRNDDTVYLGCGLDDRFDLGVTEGGTGLDHVAIRITDDQFDEFERRFEEDGVDYEYTGDEEPGDRRGLTVTSPTGIDYELLVVDVERYLQVNDTGLPERSAFTPTDFDHVNLCSNDVESDVEFVKDVLDFDVSEIQRDPDEGHYELVFTRFGDYHHDVAFTITDTPDYNLHHISFTFPSVDHMKTMIDELARNDVEMESAMSRHRAGNNIFAYFWTPTGNRIELSTEMTALPPETDTVHREETFTFTSWGGITPPESFSEGS